MRWKRMESWPLCAVFLLAGAVFIANTAAAAMLLPPDLAEQPGELAYQEALAIILEDLADQHDALVTIQRALVERPGIAPENGGDGEENKALWIEDWLAREGLPPPERMDFPDDRVTAKIRPNLILRHPKPSLNRPTLWLVAYLDNSPPGNAGAWKSPPLTLRVNGDLLFGLGVQDNNDAIAATLLLFRSLVRHQSVAPFNLGALLMADEKHGGARGFLRVIAKRPGLFGKDDCFLVFSYGDDNGSVIEIGEKCTLWLKVRVLGKQTHSAMPNKGKNALDAGAEFIYRLSTLHEQFPAHNLLFDPPYSTFVPTRPEAALTSVNQVPGEFIFHIDVRLLADYQPEKVQAAVEKLAADIAGKYDLGIRVERTALLPCSPVTPPETPLVRAMTKAVEKQLGRPSRLRGIGGQTLAADFRGMGFPAVVWRAAAFQENHPDESMSITGNLNEAAVAARLLFDPDLAEAALAVPNEQSDKGRRTEE